MRHVRNVTVPRRCAEALDANGIGYFALALLALLGGLVVGLKPSDSEA